MATYYVDPAGSDSANGTSTGTAWQTVNKVNTSTFSAGDSILFKKGGIWREQLTPQNSGSSGGGVITFGAYGTGNKPIISGSTVVSTWTGVGDGGSNFTGNPGVSGDDGYWCDTGDFNNNLNWSYVAGVYSASPTKAFVRFPSVTIAKNATINTAYVNFVAAGTDTTGTKSVTIYGIKEANATAPTSAADGNGRTLTTASVSWTAPANWQADETYQTANIATIISELTSQASWASGNAICLLFVTTGTTYEYHITYTKDLNSGPTLTVSYGTGGGPIYSASCAWTPGSVFANGNILVKVASQGAMTPGTYYYSSGTLYVLLSDASDPNSATIEASHYPNQWYGLIHFTGLGYLTFDGLKIMHSFYYGINFSNSNHITVTNCDFNCNYGNDIFSAPGTAGQYNTYITITNNRSDYSGVGRFLDGASEGCLCSVGDTQHCTISGNTSNYQYGESFNFYGGLTDITFEHNEAIDGQYYGVYVGAGYGQNGGNIDGVIVRYNKFNAKYHQICVAAEATNKTINNVQVYYNICNAPTSASAGLLFGNGLSGEILTNCLVANNTFTGGLYQGLLIQGRVSDASNVFKNNLYNMPSSCYAIYVSDTNSNEAYYSPDYDCLYNQGSGANLIYWRGTTYATLAAFKTAKSKMMNSVSSAPLLNADFTIQTTSPCRNAGNSAGLTTDYFGHTISGNPDIGAYEMAGIYYVDPAGSDSNTGLTTDTPWQTVSKVNSSSFAAGDQILFKKGGIWREQLTIPSGGSDNTHRITYGAYGSGAKPIFKASDLKNTAGDWTQDSSGGTVTPGIAVTADDGYWAQSETEYNNSISLYMGRIDTTRAGMHVWTRFVLNVPKDATITAAKVTFKSRETKTISMPIRTCAEAADNPTAPTSASDGNSRTRTTAHVDWTGTSFTNGSTFDTPDIKTVIQEIVNRSGWVSGNAINIFQDDNGGTNNNYLNVDAVGDATPAVLTVTYTATSGSMWYLSSITADPVVFAHDGTIGAKKGTKGACSTQWDYWWDDPNDRFYVYSSANPTTLATNLEVGARDNCMHPQGLSHIIFDNLEFQHSRGFAVVVHWGGA